MIIRVSNDDIRLGLAGTSFGCPVARAIHRQFPELYISVLPSGIRLGSAPRVKTPCRVQRFIRKFDGGEQVAPFAFRLKVL